MIEAYLFAESQKANGVAHSNEAAGTIQTTWSVKSTEHEEFLSCVNTEMSDNKIKQSTQNIFFKQKLKTSICSSFCGDFTFYLAIF